LGRLGFAYKRTRTRPGAASQAAQLAFLEEHKNLLDADGPTDKVHVYFNDAVHPTYNTRSDYGWILKGDEYEVASTGSRKRVNLHGVLNAHQPQQMVVRAYECINSQAVIDTWESQLALHSQGTIYNRLVALVNSGLEAKIP
jgi:hypothetical protein